MSKPECQNMIFWLSSNIEKRKMKNEYQKLKSEKQKNEKGKSNQLHLLKIFFPAFKCFHV